MVNIQLETDTLKEKVDQYSKFCIVTEMADKTKLRGLIYDDQNSIALNHIFGVVETGKVGALVIGGTGSGKTLIFSMMQKVLPKYDKSFFLIKNCKEIVAEYNAKNGGHAIFSKWKDHNILFDDLGTESEGNFYQDKIEVMESFIQARYELFINKGLVTHITTNIGTDEILKRYGKRCVSRLKQMCDTIALGAEENYIDRRELRNFIGLPDVIHPPQKSADDIAWEKKYKAAMQESKAKPMEPHPETKGLGARKREFYDQWEKLSKEYAKNNFITMPIDATIEHGFDFISAILAKIPMNSENTDFVHDLMQVQSNQMNDYKDMVEKTKAVIKKHLGDYEMPQEERPADWRNEVIEIFTTSTTRG
jgi:energy-coupling factor transporter ATP-binding protein EcfA2